LRRRRRGRRGRRGKLVYYSFYSSVITSSGEARSFGEVANILNATFTMF